MEFETAQRDMSAAYAGGAPGVLVSGLVWLVAGFVWLRFETGTAFAALFVGGMLIMPLSVLVARGLLGTNRPMPGNPLERLALESTFFLFAGILIAYALLQVAPALVFPAMAVTIGARYFTFRTIYGDPLYWALASCIVAAGAAAVKVVLPGNLALAVGTIELVFAAWLFARHTGGSVAAAPRP